MCAREVAGPRRDAARDPRARPLLRRRRPRAAPRLPRRGRARCGSTSGRAVASHAMALEFAEQDPPHPGLSRRRRLRAGRRVAHAGLQRGAVRAAAGRRRGGRRRRSRSVNRYPDPSNTRLRRRCRAATTSRPTRIAIGNGSCDILLAAGEALLEPGAELVYAWPSFCVYPHLAAASGARAIESRSTPSTATTSTRCSREITVATRLVIVCNPNNPTHRAAARRDRGVHRARSRATSA